MPTCALGIFEFLTFFAYFATFQAVACFGPSLFQRQYPEFPDCLFYSGSVLLLDAWYHAGYEPTLFFSSVFISDRLALLKMFIFFSFSIRFPFLLFDHKAWASPARYKFDLSFHRLLPGDISRFILFGVSFFYPSFTVPFVIQPSFDSDQFAAWRQSNFFSCCANQ